MTASRTGLTGIGQRQCDRAFITPSPAAASDDLIWTDSVGLSPLSQAFGSAVERNHSVASRIAGLLKSSGPAHITRLVMAVVVDAVKAVLRRRFAAYDIEEVLIRVESELNPSATVVAECVVRRVGAAALGAQIADIFRRLISSRLAVYRRAPSRPFRVQTTAGLCGSSSKVTTPDGHLISTGAQAVPPTHTGALAGGRPGIADDSESRKHVAGEIPKPAATGVFGLGECVENLGTHNAQV